MYNFNLIVKNINKVLQFIKLYSIITFVLISYQFSSDDYMEEIPVPIPNTEVKLQCAENTCGLPCWENRLLLDFIHSSLAQLVERSAVNR